MIKSSNMGLVWVWEVIPVNTLAPVTKITKKIRNGIINTYRDTKSINNQLILFLLVIVYKSFC